MQILLFASPSYRVFSRRSRNRILSRSHGGLHRFNLPSGGPMNVRNQNFQLSQQKPTSVMAPPSHLRLPSHGLPLRADHAIDTLGNGN